MASGKEIFDAGEHIEDFKGMIDVRVKCKVEKCQL